MHEQIVFIVPLEKLRTRSMGDGTKPEKTASKQGLFRLSYFYPALPSRRLQLFSWNHLLSANINPVGFKFFICTDAIM